MKQCQVWCKSDGITRTRSPEQGGTNVAQRVSEVAKAVGVTLRRGQRSHISMEKPNKKRRRGRLALKGKACLFLDAVKESADGCGGWVLTELFGSSLMARV